MQLNSSVLYYYYPDEDICLTIPQYKVPCYSPNCNLYTDNPPYCKIHLELNDLAIEASTVQPDQVGLFAFNDCRKQNDILFQYDSFITLFGDAKYNKIDIDINDIYQGGPPIYSYYCDDSSVYDCSAIRFLGSFAQSCTKTNFEPNAIFCLNESGNLLWLKATENIYNGDEIIVELDDYPYVIYEENKYQPPKWWQYNNKIDISDYFSNLKI